MTDNFHHEIQKEAERMAGLYMEQPHMDDDGAVAYVREFISLLAPVMEEETLQDPLRLALNALTHIEVFKRCFVKGYEYADKKSRAIESLKNALDS